MSAESTPRGAQPGAEGSPASPTPVDRPEGEAYPYHTGYPPGLMLWCVIDYAPGFLKARRAAHAAGEKAPPSRGYPVVVVRSLPSQPGHLLVYDGAESYPVPIAELGASRSEGVEDMARPFTNADASPSRRCETPPPPHPAPPSMLGWVSAAGLERAGQATFAVPGRALRHIIGRGGATVRRMEACLGVLIGAVDGPGDTAAVSLCGPPHRLAAAERLVRLVGQGHRSLLQRLEERPGAWAGAREPDAGE